MVRCKYSSRRRLFRVTAALLTAAVAILPVRSAFALITGGEGNQPVHDPGWPEGAAAIFNHPGRVAWWEGPPFGGGQWHAECRGDAQALSAVLADFAKLDVKSKRIVLHDGVGASFWLNANREPAKRDAARIDWTFVVWQPGSWKRLQNLPAGLNPTDPRDAEKGPPAQIDIFTGGNVRWSEVTVPTGIAVDDQRLESHGFAPKDGVVLEGRISSSSTRQPLAGKVRLQRIEPQPKGGYLYNTLAEAAADANGRWVLKNAPSGNHRVLVDAEGFVPRVIGYVQFDDQPRWSAHDGSLSRPGTVSGKVTDEAGKPVADVAVRFDDVVDESGVRYESADPFSCSTDAEGRFRSDNLPEGRATIWIHKPGHTRPGLGEKVVIPAADVALRLMKAGRIVVTVDFTGTKRPAEYLVEINPPGGPAVGTWGGSGRIDDKNRLTLDDVPPGQYVLVGRPNPGAEREQSAPLKIELKGGQVLEVELSAKPAP